MRHEEIQAALEEISRHNRSTNISQSANHDMDLSDNEELGHKLLIFLLIFCMLLMLVIGKALISFGSRAQPLSRYRPMNEEL